MFFHFKYPFLYVFDKNNGEEPLRIFDVLTGEEYGVAYYGGYSETPTDQQVKEYLLTKGYSPAVESFKCLDILDTTLILNKDVRVQEVYNDEYQYGRKPMVLHIKEAIPNMTYRFTIDDGTIEGYHEIEVVAKPDPDLGEDADKALTTNDIVNKIMSEISKKYDLTYYTFSDPRLSWSVEIGDLGIIVIDSCIIFYTVPGAEIPLNWNVFLKDSHNNRIMSLTYREVNKVSDLPPEAYEGMVVKITGDGTVGDSSWYVKRVNTDEGGYWEETRDFGEEGNYWADKNKGVFMPLRIFPSYHGITGELMGFLVMMNQWEERKVGDRDSIPPPSFIGNTIDDMFLFKNRLGFLSADNVILSEAGNYFNFYGTTVTDVLDGDPIDVSIQSKERVTLLHTEPMADVLLIMGDKQQFLLHGAGILTPMTVSVDTNSYYDVSRSCSPVSSGNSVFFVSPKQKFQSVRELFIQQDSTSEIATDITAHVPKYIDKPIKKMVMDTHNNTLYLLPKGQSDTLWVYTYYWEGNDKVQSAWSKWVFPEKNIYDINLKDNYLYLFTTIPAQQDNKLVIETINLNQHNEEYRPEDIILLDSLVKLKGQYYEELDKTVWELPYKSDSAKVIDGDTGLELTGMIRGYTMLEASGNRLEDNLYFGIPYSTLFRLSRWYLRDRNDIALTQGHLQVRNIIVSYEDSHEFKIKIKNGSRETTQRITDTMLGASRLQIGQVKLSSGHKKVFVGGNSRDVKIELINDSHYPSKFPLISYEGFWTTRSNLI